MANEISKQEYLKRYLENDKDSERKRKKKKSLKGKTVSRIKIIHEDIDLKSINFGEKAEEEDNDEAPIVAEVIDERPMEEKLKEMYESSRWKKIVSDELPESSSTMQCGSSSAKSANESFKRSANSEESDSFGTRVKARHDSDEDINPRKNYEKSNKRRHDSDDDTSGLRSQRCSDSDISPPRSHKQKNNSKHGSDSDMSPPRSHKQRKHNSDSDVSPPRSHKQRKHNSDSDISPPRSHKQRKHDSDSDISPPRSYKQRKHDSDSDFSPAHHKTVNKLLLLSKDKSKRHDSDSDISPPRYQSMHKSHNQSKTLSKRLDSDDDNAPSHPNFRNKKKSPRISSKNKRESRQNFDSDVSPPRSASELYTVKDKSKKLGKTLSGLKAGLQNSEALQEEVKEQKKREKIQLNMMDDEISGRNAETIVRNRKTGMKRDLLKEQEAKIEESKKVKEFEEKYNKWGKGIEQTEDKVEKFKDDLYEMSKPLARYRDDIDLDEKLKSVLHDDDPMLSYIRKKQKKNAPSVPIYSGPPAPPNRFGILPGYRWDGVDRSNGFEKKYFEKINSVKAVQDEAYLWSVQDM